MNVIGRRHKLGDRPPAPRTSFWKCRGCFVRVPLRVLSEQKDGTIRTVKTGRCPRCGRHRKMTAAEQVLLEGGYSTEFRREFPRTMNMVHYFINKLYRDRREFIPRDDLTGPMMMKACYAAMTYADPEIQFTTYLVVCLKQKGDYDVHIPETHLSLEYGDFNGEGFEVQKADRTRETEEELDDARETIAMLLYRAGLDKNRTQILRWRYGIGGTKLTLREIGEKLGFSKERARQLQHSALERLRRMAEQERLIPRAMAT